jgi:hypothetical protein
MRARLALSVLFAAATGAHAADLPAAVEKDLQAVADLCREAGGKPLTADAVKTVDLNADGKPDYVLDVDWVGCDGAAGIYGDREKAVTVYVGDGKGGAVVAYSGSVFGANLEGSRASTKLWVTVSGALCGKPAAPDFASESFCDRALLWSAKTAKFELAPISAARMIQ